MAITNFGETSLKDVNERLAERGLALQRHAWHADQTAQTAFWQRVGLPARPPDELRVSVFGYPGAPLEALLDVWATGPPTSDAGSFLRSSSVIP